MYTDEIYQSERRKAGKRNSDATFATICRIMILFPKKKAVTYIYFSLGQGIIKM
jgi:hypothetical protein